MRILSCSTMVCGILLSAAGTSPVLAQQYAPPPSTAVVPADSSVNSAYFPDASASAPADSSGSSPLSQGYYPPVNASGGAPEGYPPPAEGYGYGYDPNAGYGYPPYAGGGYPPAYGTPEGQIGSIPPTMAPWPAVSPFEHNFDQTHMDGGLWYNNANNDKRHWYFSVEYLWSKTMRPERDLIGSVNHQIPVVPTAPWIFPSHTAGAISDNLNHPGIRGRIGFMNTDDTGWDVTGWGVFRTSQIGDIQGNPFTGNIFQLKTLGSITYNDGSRTLYDSQFTQDYTTEANGVDVSWYTTPFFSRKNLKLRLVYGAKYVRVYEQWRLQASDSNLNYIYAVPSGAITVPTITNSGLAPFTSNMLSSVNSNLVGPEVGIKYEIGGDKLRFWGMTKFSPAVNIDSVNLSGNNMTDRVTAGLGGGPYFSDSGSGVHFSPILDTSIFAEFPIFGYLPILNKMSLFKDCNFRIGYNYMRIGLMERPAGDIDYNINNPTLKSNRSAFSISTVSFAIDWHF